MDTDEIKKERGPILESNQSLILYPCDSVLSLVRILSRERDESAG
jgi:hypothetical protein